MGSGGSQNNEGTEGEVDDSEEVEDVEAAFESETQSSSPSTSTHHSMTTISRQYFGGDSSADNHTFFIDIIEKIREDYGMFVWPCSIVLSEYVWQQRSRFSGVSVLELGAGTSLPGLVAAKVGAKVTLTDNSKHAEVLENMKRICDLNKLNCEIIGLTWGEWDESVFNLHPQIMLGADVLYDSSDFDDLFATVAFLLHSCPESVFITTYQDRSGHHLIEFLMVKWGLKCSKLLDGYSCIPPQKVCGMPGIIHLVEIVLNNQDSS
ncbi:methyltransferase-like protein 23 [Zingiber officinale]|uniref:methyltransferase-like protein 23 n=1 Tax=Zingiber officinale TaxID=94328 RepID=UPI001C4D9101|nr:methyltransferase-like protein 23 [Zingiber officinale]XP_042440682.1 methyltransferase-like protein 23 [Zingiber officinale]